MRWTILCTILRSPRHDFLGIVDLTLFIQLHSLVLDDEEYLLWDLRVIANEIDLGLTGWTCPRDTLTPGMPFPVSRSLYLLFDHQVSFQ